MSASAAPSSPSVVAFVPGKESANATVQVRDLSGTVIATAPASDASHSFFTVPLTAPPPAVFQVTADVPASASGPAVHYAARVESYKGGAVVLDRLSTQVSEYADAHAGISVRDATRVVYRQSASVTPVVQRARGEEAAARVTAPMAAPAPNDDNDSGGGDDLSTAILNLTVGMGSSLLTPLGSTIKTPLVGWLTRVIGLPGPSQSSDMSGIKGDLAAISTAVNAVPAAIDRAVKQLSGKVDFDTLQTPTSYVQTWAGYMGSQAPPSDILTNSQYAPYLIAFHNILVGSPDGTAEAYLSQYADLMAPGFYCDETQLPILMEQFTYYQVLQFSMMNMLVEACHSQSWGADYSNATKFYEEYAAQIQYQSTFLPFSTGFLAGDGVLHKGTWNFWFKQNIAGDLDVSGFAIGDIVNAGEVNSNGNNYTLLPTQAELQALATDVATAYEALNGSGSSSGVSLQTMLNTFGFNVSFTTPLIMKESIDNASWSAGPYGGSGDDPYWTIPAYDPIGNQVATMELHLSDSAEGNIADDFKYVTSATWYDGSGLTAQTHTLPASALLDSLPLYRLAPGDAALGEPLGISVDPPGTVAHDGTMTLTASGHYHRYNAEWANPAQDCYLDVTAGCFWSVDHPDVASISNDPSNPGTLTWLKNGTVNVTIRRGQKLAATKSVSNSTGAVSQPAKMVALNVSPQTVTVDPSASGQMNVQILYSDSSTDPAAGGVGVAPGTAMPATPVKLTISDPANVSIDSNGKYTLGANASGTITITATSGTLSDKMTITVGTSS